MFKASKTLNDSVTVLATFSASNDSAVYGFYVGDVVIKVNKTDIVTNSAKIGEVNGNVSIRAILRFNGQVTLQNDEGINLCEPFTVENSFDGLNLSEMGIFLESCEVYPISVTLKGLAVYSSAGSDKIPYWVD